VFHFVNSWEYKNEANEDCIVLWGCALTYISLDFNESEHPFVYSEDNKSASKLNKWTFNLKTGVAEMKEMDPTPCEFPIID